MPKLGRSYTVDVLLPDEHGGALSAEEIPPGFALLLNGRGAVRITARDRDRFGEPATIASLVAVLCDNATAEVVVGGLSFEQFPAGSDLSNAEWQERFRHAR